MKSPLRAVILVLVGAVLLIMAGWIVTVILFKSDGRTEEPHRTVLQLSR